MEKMASKQRVLAAFNRQPVDRLPVISPTSVATVESMLTVNAAFPEAHTDAKKMAALAAAGHNLLGFDNVAPCFSVQQEAAALGAGMNWGQIDTMPSAILHPYDEPNACPRKSKMKTSKRFWKQFVNCLRRNENESCGDLVTTVQF